MRTEIETYSPTRIGIPNVVDNLDSSGQKDVLIQILTLIIHLLSLKKTNHTRLLMRLNSLSEQ